MVKREEIKRMREMGRPGIVDGSAAAAKKTVTTKQKVVLAADRVASGILGNTVGRVARFASRRVLGRIPDEAIKGSYNVSPDAEDILTDDKMEVTLASSVEIEVSKVSDDGLISVTDIEGQVLLEEAIAEQLQKDASVQKEQNLDKEDEALFAGLYNDESSASSEKKKPKEVVA
jgi:hypothetical protein